MKKLLLLLLLTILLFSCNKEESIIDTDGDGMSDSKELEFFNPEVDATTYNPNISDLPILDIEVYDIPQLSINYIKTSTTSSSTNITRDRESEDSWMIGGRASATVSATVKASVGILDTSVSGSGTVSGTVEVSGEMSGTIRKSISESREYARENSLTAEEAKISVPVFLKNIGNMPVSIKDLTLTAYSINMYNEMEMIGSLKAEDFGNIYLQPGNDPVIINFQNDSIYPSTIERIMYFSKRIVVVPASYSMDIISNDEVISYHEAYSTVKAKTLRVHFKSDIYDINNQKFDVVCDIVAGDLTEVFDVLNMNYTIRDEWIYSLNGQRGHNILFGGEWEIRHIGIRDRKEFDCIYNSNNPNLEVEIKPGDNVFIYRTEIKEKDKEDYSISHRTIKGFNEFGNVNEYIKEVDKEVKLERNSERGVYQEIYLDLEPQRRLVIETADNILFEFSIQADLGGGISYEIDPNAEEAEYVKSYDRSPKRVFINGKKIKDLDFTHTEIAFEPGVLVLDLDALGFPEDEKIEVIDFYFYGGANPNILPYTPKPSEAGAKAKWYVLTHVETYIFNKR